MAVAGYKTVAAPARYEFEVKGSRFIGSVAPAATEDEAKAFLESVRAEMAGARHNVFAWVLKSGAERQSDDGEPQKTAGLPTLQVLRGSGLKDLVLVTTRYFGGTLLGTGGLVRAYTQAAHGALDAAEVAVVDACVDIALVLPYPCYDKASHLIGLEPAKVLSTAFTDTVSMSVRMIAGTEAPLVAALQELLGGKGSLQVSDPFLTTF